jgi:diguanylate cyclase (GGDEF)-like protein
MSAELVSAFAGDREVTSAERNRIAWQRKSRGSLFFSDLLYAISHQYFAPELASLLWEKILAHKYAISTQLGRNVRFTVATLDYLSNIQSELASPTLISEAYISEIADLAMRDGMTGLFNHSTCYELLELEFKRHARYGLGVSVLLLDIDDFKAINEGKGHQRGDQVLVEVAKHLGGEARDSDICCRLGGDEFVVVLRQTDDAVEACAIAERIRDKVTTVAVDGRVITVSIGVALRDSSTSSPHALLERCDRALHEAKLQGKNCVVLAPSNQ